MTDLTGQSIGRYQILTRLGEGGMAVVYKARDTRLDRDVALKLIRVDQFGSAILDQILKRFEREAKSLARLSHPSIVTVHDYGEHENVPYLVLEYCPGGDLKNRLTGLPMDWQEALQLIMPVARALRYSHKQGLVHRDVKPSNIMFSGEGEPMLSDFGIAKILEQDNVATLTGTGVGIGTPGYMAPEQWTGETSPASDQYGLGVVLYELLTGRKPYEADTPAGILIKQTSQPQPPPRQFAPAIPAAVESAVLKALEKDPTRRYSDMAAFIKAFESLLQQTPVVETPTTVGGPNKTLDVVPVVVLEEKHRAPTPVDLQTTTTPVPDAKKINWKAILGSGVVLAALVGLIWGGMQLAKGFPAQSEPSATSIPPTNIEATASSPIEYVVQAGDTCTGIAIAFNLTVQAIIDTNNLDSTCNNLFVGQKLYIPLAPSSSETRLSQPTPTLTAAALPEEIIDSKGVKMRLVPAGPFTMGSDSGSTDEAHVHTVTLDDYYMDVYEVTNAQYAACVDAGKCTPPYGTGSSTRSNYFRNSAYMNFPVIYVDWNQAKAYCEWRGARLPTEAEWEKAVRGTDGRTYPWGNTTPSSSLANYDTNKGDTTEVGSYESDKSPYGMYDMAGNVWEWVNDWYDSDYYQNSPTENPQGPSSGDSRVLRGGSWFVSGDLLRSSGRGRSSPDYRNSYLGFRCSRSAASP